MLFHTPQPLRKVVSEPIGFPRLGRPSILISHTGPLGGHQRNGVSRHQAMPLQQEDGCPQGRWRKMCEGVPSGPGSFRELQNWQQPPPKQTQTTSRESSGQHLEPARVSPSCVSQTQINLPRGIPPPTQVHQSCCEGQRSSSAVLLMRSKDSSAQC